MDVMNDQLEYDMMELKLEKRKIVNEANIKILYKGHDKEFVEYQLYVEWSTWEPSFYDDGTEVDFEDIIDFFDDPASGFLHLSDEEMNNVSLLEILRKKSIGW